MRWAKEVARLDPSAGEAYYALGVAMAASGNIADARGAMRRAVRRAPRLVAGYLRQAEYALLLGEPQAAVDLYDAATVVAPDNPAGWLGLSRALAQLGFMNQARDAATEVIRLRPHSPEGYVVLGEIYADQGRQAEARPLLEQAYALRERSPQLYALLALTYADQPRNDEDTRMALQFGARALELGDRSSRLYFGLGLAYQRQRRYPEAIQAFRTLLKDYSAAHGAWVCLAQCYRAQGRNREAAQAARTAQRIIAERQVVDRLRNQIQQAPHRLELRQQLADHCLKTGNYFMAADHYAYLAKQVPNGARYWRLAARALHRAGAEPQARQAEQLARDAELGRTPS